MKYHLFILAALLSSPLGEVRSAYAAPFTPETGSQAETKKKLPWAFTPDPALPNVLILGDSISIGYTLRLRALLKGKANVFRPITKDGSQAVNCEGTTAGLKRVDNWLDGQKWAVIHFNWGLHDLKHVNATGVANSNNPETPVQASVADYRRNLMRIVGKLTATGARLVFANRVARGHH